MLLLSDAANIPLKDNSIDSIVTDPPYGLSFMGKDWDHGIPGVRFWEAALRVAKPGAHLLAFGGTRTFHRLAVAIEDAGWEIRDTIGYIYGSGFPKSHNVGKAIDKLAGSEREVIGSKRAGFGKRDGVKDSEGGIFLNSLPEKLKQVPITAPVTEAAKQWDGWGTALKPAWEPVIVARKPFKGTVASNVLEHGTGAINIDGCRVEATHDDIIIQRKRTGGVMDGVINNDVYGNGYKRQPAGNNKGRWPANIILSYPEDEYILRDDLTKEQKIDVFQWLQENA